MENGEVNTTSCQSLILNVSKTFGLDLCLFFFFFSAFQMIHRTRCRHGFSEGDYYSAVSVYV
jgi:hypothetical protein